MTLAPGRRSTSVVAGTVVAVAASLAVLACGGGGPGSDTAATSAATAETDRVVRTVADAISYPRQDSADGLARAALATRAGSDGRLTVLSAEDLGDRGTAPDAAVARLVVRVDLGEPVVACYDVDFTYHGPLGRPEPRPCPEGAVAYVPPAAAPPPTLPADAADRLRAALESLPPAGRHDVPAVRAAVSALGLGAAPDVHRSPDPGPVVGVAVRAGGDCVMARVLPDGTVEAWSPPRVTVQPGEAGCGGAVATDPPGPPH